ncbi:MAG: lysylphosphatidylglycerol synthase transmembrane domain-containing protein [Bacteroidota bacterium]
MPDSTPTPASPSNPPAFSVGRLIGSVVLSVFVLAGIAWWTYEPGMLEVFKTSLNGGILALAFAALGLRLLLSAGRIAYVSHGTIGMRHALRGQLLWEFASSVTPSVIGGGPVAAFFIARDAKLSIGDVTAIMLFAMLLDQFWFAIAIIGLFTASFFIDVYPDGMGTLGAGAFVLYFTVILVWAAVFGYATLLRPDLVQRLAEWVFGLRPLRRFKERAQRGMAAWEERAKIIRSQPLGFFATAVSMASGVWIIRYAELLLVALAVYPTLDALTFYVRSAAMMLGALILPTPGGAGGIEGLYALFLGPLMPAALLVPTLILWRLLTYYLIIAAGSVLSALVMSRQRG